MANIKCVCPHCESDLRGPVIPEESRYMFMSEPSDECDGGCGSAPHFSRLIGIYSQEQDRTTHWRCPDCGKQWER